MGNEQLEIAKSRLKAYYEAEMTVLTGQSYTIGTRSLTRANLAEIRKAIVELEKKVEELTSLGLRKGRRKAYRITPRDL